MSAIIRIPVIFLVSLYSVQMHMFRSSYFKVSSKPDPYTEKDFLLTTTVRDELSCASNCNANTHCQSALFDKDSRKCSLIKAKKLLHHHNTDESGATGKIVLEKVRWRHVVLWSWRPVSSPKIVPVNRYNFGTNKIFLAIVSQCNSKIYRTSKGNNI